MGCEPWPILDLFDPEEIADKIIECNSNLNKVAKYFNVTLRNLRNAIEKTPYLQDAFEQGRYNFGETFLDGSENVMVYLMNNVKQDPKHAFMAAKFVLENLGHARGYGQKLAPSPENQTYQGVAREAENIKQLYEMGKIPKVVNVTVE